MIPYVPLSLCRLTSLPLHLLTHLYLCLLLSRLTPVLFELFLISAECRPKQMLRWEEVRAKVRTNKRKKEVSSTPLEVEDEEVMGTTMLVQDKMTTGWLTERTDTLILIVQDKSQWRNNVNAAGAARSHSKYPQSAKPRSHGLSVFALRAPFGFLTTLGRTHSKQIPGRANALSSLTHGTRFN